MSFLNIAKAVACVVMVVTPGAALAQAGPPPAAPAAATPLETPAPNMIKLMIGGQGHDGPPQFLVKLDGKVVATGTVDKAIDADKAGRFANATDKAEYIEAFTFPVAAADFSKAGTLAIALTNGSQTPAGSGHARKLYIESASVNGITMGADKFVARSAAGVEPIARLGRYLVLSENGIDADLAPPEGGWPAVSPSVAEAKPASVAAPVPAPKEASTKTTKVTTPAPQPKLADTTGSAPGPRPEASVVAPAPVDHAPKPAPVVPADKPAVVAAMEAKAPPSGRCTLTKSFSVLGFNKNSNALTPAVVKRLDAIARVIGANKCKVRVVGYSSTEGSYARNALFSVERARNALHYLKTKGIKFTRFSASGVGETTQFGAAPWRNRRVEITVMP